MSSEPRSLTAGSERWPLSLALAALATAAVCWPAWPGLMSYDSLYAVQESRAGIETVLWPPMHAYLFWISEHLGASVWGVLLLQTGLLFLGAALSFNLLARRARWAVLAFAAFALAFVYVPELLGTAMAHWRDATTAAFAMAGLGAWLAAAHRRSWSALALAAMSFGMAAALRYNAILLIGPVALLMVWTPFLEARATVLARGVTAALLAVCLGLAWASTHWRLPDLRPMPDPNSIGGTQEFDLIGVSACANKVYLPPHITAGWPITPRQIRMVYDPRHLQMAYAPKPGVPKVLETAAQGQVAKVWPLAIRAELPCYVAHRTAVFVEQMGLAKQAVFYPIHGGIDPNPYGLTLAHPQSLAKVSSYIQTRAPELWRRPFLLYLLAPMAVAVLWLRRAPQRLLCLALLGGAYAYSALLLVAAPAADARYIYPSSVFCAFILAGTAMALIDAHTSKPR